MPPLRRTNLPLSDRRRTTWRLMVPMRSRNSLRRSRRF